MNLLWVKQSEEEFKAGFRRMLRKVFLMPDGEKEVYDIKNEGYVVCVLALTEDGQVILTKQFRPGPEKILEELPGGGVEKDEDPLDAAERELLEETGYKGDLEFVGTTWNCGYSNRVTHNFVALNCKKFSQQKLDGTEFIEVVTMNIEDFRKHLQKGELTDVKTGYACLDFLGKL